MDVDTLLVGTIIIIGIASVSLIDKWKKKGKENYRKSNATATILFFLAVAGAYLTYNSGLKSREQSKLDKRQKEYSDSVLQEQFSKYLVLSDSLRAAQEFVKELQNRTLAKVTDQLEKTNNVLSYSQKLNEAQTNISRLQDELNSQVTGGKNNIPVVTPGIFQGNLIQFDISSYGKYPLSNIILQIAERRKVVPETLTYESMLREMERNQHQFDVDIILPHLGTGVLYEYKVQKDDDLIGMSFWVKWRNGAYYGNFDVNIDDKGSVTFKNIKYIMNNKEFNIYSYMK